MRHRILAWSIFATLLASLSACNSSSGGSSAPPINATVFAVRGDNELIRFHPDVPDMVEVIATITPLDGGEQIIDIDFRSAEGDQGLYALTNAGRLLIVDPDSGEATEVAGFVPPFAVDPELVAQQDALGIGMLVLDGLASEVIARGVAGARELLANNTLLAQYDIATGAPLGNSVHGLFATLMLENESAIQSRLDTAAASLAGAQAPEPGEAPGLPGADELEGLSTAEAERVILSRLAGLVHAQGAEAVHSVLTEDSQVDRLAGVTWLLDRLDDSAHRSYRTRVWLAGVVSFILALVLFAVSSGWGRVFNPGLSVLLAAGPGLLALLALQGAHARLQGSLPPGAFELEGGLLHAWRSQEHAFSLIPVGSLELLVQDVAILAGIGALLVLIAVLGLVVQAVRPRRGRL